MRHIFIGDVHGCNDELGKLLELVKVVKEDHLIFVGDLVDRGPDSAGVVRRVLQLCEQGYQVTLVKGNHEDKWFRVHKKVLAGDMAGVAKMKNGCVIHELQKSLHDTEIKTLQEMAVLFYRVPEHNILVVHGGISRNLKLPDSIDELNKLRNKEKKRLKLVMMTRYISAKTGNMVTLNQEQEGDPFWAAVYDGRYGRVVFGHEPFSNVMHFSHAIGIDTSCCFGGKLTALVIAEDGVEDIYQIDALKRYSDRKVE